MKCPSCEREVAEAEFCPACLAALPKVAPVAAAPAPAAPTAATPADVSASRRRGTLLAMLAAALLGAGAAALLSRRASGPDPECVNLCQFAEIPAVAGNARWQEQVAEHSCRCNALPKNAPPAQPVKPPATGP